MNTTPATQQTKPNYDRAKQNGPMYKTDNAKKVNNGNEFEQRPGESTEDDNERTV